MAIQSQSAARARSDAVAGALTIAAIVIFAAGLYTFLEDATGSIAPDAAIEVQAAGYPPAGTEQMNLERTIGDLQGRRIEVERLGGTQAELDWLDRQVAATRDRLGSVQDVQKALIDIRAAERAGR